MDSDKKRPTPKSFLPGFNCGACGEKRCEAFAEKLIAGQKSLDQCPYMAQERFSENRARLTELLEQKPAEEKKQTDVGLIDGYQADFKLLPLPGEPACREVLFPFSRIELKVGDVIRYRPLGCPMIHFATIIEESHGLITVHMIGPRHRAVGDEDFQFIEVGVCMVGGFEGVVEGPRPFVGQTVRFLPHHCMMQKVHSGVVVQMIGDQAIIEGIDLKVWAPPI
mgnify:FL=1